MQFSDMARVHQVDARLLERTQKWLIGRQHADGGWGESAAETAFTGWAMAQSGYRGEALDRAAAFLRRQPALSRDPYTIALALNFFVAREPDSKDAAEMAGLLAGLASVRDGRATWLPAEATITQAHHYSGQIETTALAALGLLVWNGKNQIGNQAVNALVDMRGSYGAWGSTQATVWAIKAILEGGGRASSEARGTLTVIANGARAAEHRVTAENADLVRMVDLRENVKAGENRVRVDYEGAAMPVIQIVGRYYTAWSALPLDKALQLRVQYDRTTLAANETVTATVTFRNLGPRAAESPLLDIGVPPGFDVERDALEEAVSTGKIKKYAVTGRQVILYLDRLNAGATFTLSFGLRARYPLRVQTRESRAYPYYNPERTVIAPPQWIVVR
jgi:alpha-2-macroglobulin-like protein